MCHLTLCLRCNHISHGSRWRGAPWSRSCPSCSRGRPAWGRRRWRDPRTRWPPQPGMMTRTVHSVERHLQDTEWQNESVSSGMRFMWSNCTLKHLIKALKHVMTLRPFHCISFLWYLIFSFTTSQMLDSLPKVVFLMEIKFSETL